MPFFEIELQDHTLLVTYKIIEGMKSNDYDVPDDDDMLELEEMSLIDEEGNEVNEPSNSLKEEIKAIKVDEKIFEHYQINF